LLPSNLYIYSHPYQLCYNEIEHNNNDINNIVIFHNIHNNFDYSWYEYITYVYENSNYIKSNRYEYSNDIDSTKQSNSILMKSIKKSNINFYYQNAPISIHPIDWPKAIPFLSQFGTSHRGAYATSDKYPDYSWVEVSRFSIQYINKDWSEGYCYFDGNRGFVHPVHNNMDRIAYGCWFHKAKGTCDEK